MSESNISGPSVAHEFAYDMAHRDDADPNATKGNEQELSEDFLAKVIAACDPAEVHDALRQELGIDYPGTEQREDFQPLQHPQGL